MTKWETAEESRKRWEENADFWDQKMGEHSNSFHREIIRPGTEELLAVNPGDVVLDIACGNGNFSKRLVELGARVIAFDYSRAMIDNARKRCQKYLDSIEFKVIDATDYNQLMDLGKNSFDKAVANMALMDMSDISPLLNATYELLKPGGVFVFSVSHPCFQTPPPMRKIVETEEVGRDVITRMGVQIFNYITPCSHEGCAIAGQPVPQLYYHRPLSVLLEVCFEAGFVVDGFKEPVFQKPDYCQKFDWYELPPAIIVRLRKFPGNTYGR